MEFFDKYREAKWALNKMVAQFYDYSLSLKDASKYGIKLSCDDIKTGNYIDGYFHDFDAMGLLAWEYLGIRKMFIKDKELWNKRLNIRNEVEKDSIDYYEEYLKICILLIDMTLKFYRRLITIDEIKKDSIEYDSFEDEYDDEIDVCYHIHESAGESVWDLFEIEKPIVGSSIFNQKRIALSDKLLELKNSKANKIKKMVK